MSIIRAIRGRWRLWWKLCPACNCDAPALYACECCQSWSHYHRPELPSREVVDQWAARWKEMG